MKLKSSFNLEVKNRVFETFRYCA